MESLGKVALLLLVELPVVTLLVAFVINGFVLHIVGGQLRRLGLVPRDRRRRAEDLKHYPASRGEASGQDRKRDG